MSASVHTHAHGRIPFHSDLGVCARACVKWGRQQLATEPAERTHILYIPYTNTQIVSILCVAQPKHTHICTCGNVWVGRGAPCVTDSVFACVFTRTVYILLYIRSCDCFCFEIQEYSACASVFFSTMPRFTVTHAPIIALRLMKINHTRLQANGRRVLAIKSYRKLLYRSR